MNIFKKKTSPKGTCTAFFSLVLSLKFPTLSYFIFFTLSFCVHDLHLLFKLLIFFLGFWESLGGKEKWELSQLEKQTLELCACALVFVEKKVTVLEVWLLSFAKLATMGLLHLFTFYFVFVL